MTGPERDRYVLAAVALSLSAAAFGTAIALSLAAGDAAAGAVTLLVWLGAVLWAWVFLAARESVRVRASWGPP